jgi:hypothetical protein
MSSYLFSKSAISKTRSFAINNFQEDDIVIADSRIYRGRIAFMLHDKHYIESSLFSQIYSQTEQFEGNKLPIQTYFIECIYDDCGWGTIDKQPEFNQSTEQFIAMFQNISQKTQVIYSGGEDEVKPAGKPYFNIYKTTLNLNPLVFQLIDNTHEWFFYPVNWEGEWYDDYELDTFWKNLAHNFAYIILWIMVILTILTPLVLIKELFPEILKHKS